MGERIGEIKWNSSSLELPHTNAVQTRKTKQLNEYHIEATSTELCSESFLAGEKLPKSASSIAAIHLRTALNKKSHPI